MSCTVVTPTEAACFKAARAFPIVSSSVAGGTSRVTRSAALSLRMPVGSPAASLTMAPPSGAGVSRVMPAIFSATVFASPMWPSSRCTKTGLSGVTASINARVGSVLSGHDS